MSGPGKKMSVSKNVGNDEERCTKCQVIMISRAHHTCVTWNTKRLNRKKLYKHSGSCKDFELVSPSEPEPRSKSMQTLDIGISFGKSVGTQTEVTMPSTSEKTTQTETSFDLNESMSCEELVQILFDKMVQHRLLLTKLNHACNYFAKQNNPFL
ncbi:uncharacterized protein LOC113465260 [Ceratina calcarata]|uniref:Uncharacterized protein LOC113465260 n=1 Tax=Ceratina calcarata TaxID=156304 RepID=A0AAJ7WGR8_9HYME|nr:uncharacterized protein LOC113465260 [Ceratina calcarata]